MPFPKPASSGFCLPWVFYRSLLPARTVTTATKLGVFEALAVEARSADELACHCKTHPGATKKLLNALVGAGYLRASGKRYSLAPVARKWLLKEHPRSLHDQMLWQFTEWDWITRCEDFARTGRAIDIHEGLSEGE